MRLRRLHLFAFGPFTARTLDLGEGRGGLALIHGPNEAGKSSTLRAIGDLRFGIPHASTDNFVHEHRALLVGGEFVDRDGTAFALIRRKGRGDTLSFADFDGPQPVALEPVPPALQARLDGGLTREAYDAMFGLDHRRLREGGEALLRGEGDIGAALFEASAGARNVPLVLESLNDDARRLYMAGTRARKAPINEALAAWQEHQRLLKAAQAQPRQWSQLARQLADARAEVERLESARREAEAAHRLVVELRGVAPILSTLDAATGTLASLEQVALLEPGAGDVRAGAASGLAAAERNLLAAGETIDLHQRALDALAPDDPILAWADAIGRLAARADDIDRYRHTSSLATADAARVRGDMARVAAAIDPSLDVDAALSIAPSRTQAADIAERLQAAAFARQALDEHLAAGRDDPVPPDDDDAPPPDPLRLAALRRAIEAVDTARRELERLGALPAAIRKAERDAAGALASLGLVDEAGLRSLRPLLAAQIDTEIQADSAAATQLAGLRERIAQIDAALLDRRRALDTLRGGARTATRGEVSAARDTRDDAWRAIRRSAIDPLAHGSQPSGDDVAALAAGAAAFEAALAEADRLVDALAEDTGRAAQVQACEQQIDEWCADRAGLDAQLAQAVQAARQRADAWSAQLDAARLPRLAPAALRDWQAMLPGAVAAFDTLHAARDEHDALLATRAALHTQLCAALDGVGRPAADAPALRDLAAMARDVERALRERASRAQVEHGKAQARVAQQARLAEREAALRARVDATRAALSPSLDALRLPPDASTAVVRARLQEFEELLALRARLVDADDRRRDAARALEAIDEAIAAVRQGLGPTGTVGADPRQHIDALVARLRVAEGVRLQRERARDAQALAQRERVTQQAIAAGHAKTLDALCAAAGVTDTARLADAIEASERKRRAQERIDDALLHLARASRRPIAELRTLLAARDASALDDEEAATETALAAIDAQCAKARADAEGARLALDAIDDSDLAAAEHERMERAGAAIRSAMPHWVRTRLAHALLNEALRRFRERAQGPMLKSATAYFSRMTRGAFAALRYDDHEATPVLIAQRADGKRIGVSQMSEGTLDQLYLALRLAALELRRASGVDLPVVLDDILMTSDEQRTAAMLDALAYFAREQQVIVFTHHRHVAEIAQRAVSDEGLRVLSL
ncbi:MAG: AAA family ATPase [Lautropia sp.]